MTATIHTGHVLDVLASLPDGVARCCVTSPPYWGLRDYQTEGQAWPEVTFAPMPGLPPMTIPAMVCSLGNETDPWAFIGHLILVFRGVRRVLSNDATLWLNLGDSYIAGQGGRQSAVGEMPKAAIRLEKGPKSRDDVDVGGWSDRDVTVKTTPTGDSGLKPKDLSGMPWRAAFALQADGWYLRSDVIWSKPNPMPESVTDRPTKAHEYVFLLSKGPRYFFDQEAVREKGADSTIERWGTSAPTRRNASPQGVNAGSVVGEDTMGCNPAGRNLRSVWQIATVPFSGAHFATFPPELPERCIKAGSSEKGHCPECGAAWEREIVRGEGTRQSEGTPDGNWDSVRGIGRYTAAKRFGENTTVTTGWRPTCTHSAAPVPDVVLDPFNGAGTTGLVAGQLGRDYIGIELNPDYADMARQRLGLSPADDRREVVKAKAVEGLPLFGGTT